MSDAIIYGDGLRDAKGMIRFFIQHKTNKKLLMDAVEGWFEGRPGSQWRRHHHHFERVVVGRSATDRALEQALW